MATVTAISAPQIAAGAGIVGFNLQNPTGATLTAQPISFGQVFAAGDLPAGRQLVAAINGQTEIVQVDPKTFNADGSVKLAVLTLLQPTLAAGAVQPGVLQLAPAGTARQPAIDLPAALARYSLTVGLSIAGTGTLAVDAVAAMRRALANGTATVSQAGPLAAEASVSVPVTGSLRLAVSMTAHADGSITTKVGFNNDVALGATGGAVTYSADITQNGAVAFTQATLTQPQYENWTATVTTGAAPSAVNVQHDVDYLERTGAVANYDASAGASTSLLAAETAAVAAPGWTTPLAARGITQDMTTSGGRGDIGPTTQADAAWLVSQSAVAAQYALGQADAAAGIPWHFFNAAAGTWLNTAQYPDIWTDPRGGPASYTTGLTQQVDSANNGWSTDTAHQPDLSYTAYLLTGNQWYLDDLNAQAAWAVTNAWPAGIARNSGQGLVVQGEQIRTAAWSLREIDEAAYANPAGSVEGAYFTSIANANWSWLVSQIPAWTAMEGQAYGWLPGAYGGGVVIPPWQEDYFASTAIQAAEQGNSDALTFLRWESNFLVGRFLNAANGFNPRDGVAYNLTAGDASGTLYTSWAQIEAATAAAGGSNGTGWEQSQGDYAELGLQTLAGIITVTGSTDAVKAYGWLVAAGAPYTDTATHQLDTQFDIVPRLSDGQLLTGAHVIVSHDTADTLLRGTDNDQLISAGSGNDTLVGGAGINLLFAGSGTDVLYGGSNNDEMFGGTGAVTFVGGGGNDFFQPGTGPATIVLDTQRTGHDTVSGFRPGTDHLVVRDAAGAPLDAAALSRVLAGAGTDAAGDAVLPLASGLDVTLTGLGTDALTPALFGSSTVPAASAAASSATTAPAQAAATASAQLAQAPTPSSGSFTLTDGAVFDSTGADTINVPAGTRVSITGAGSSTTVYADSAAVVFTGRTSSGGDGVSVSGGAVTISSAATATGLMVATGAQGASTIGLASGADTMRSLGNDTITAGGASATIQAGGNALITGGPGQLSVAAGSGNLTLSGGTGNTSVTGGSGAMVVSPGSGRDTVQLGSGNSTVSFGSGVNTLRAVAGLGGGDDVINGFKFGTDMLDLTNPAGGPVVSSTAVTADGAIHLLLVDGTRLTFSAADGL